MSFRFPTLKDARPALRRLRPTRMLLIRHLCIEDRIVLRADGFDLEQMSDGWLVWRRA